MRLYIQQLEEQVRQLTGEVERLNFELRQAQSQAGGAVSGAPGSAGAPGSVGALGSGGFQASPQPGANPGLGAPPQDLGTVGIAQDDPLVAPDGATVDMQAAPQAGGMQAGPGAGGPIDLSTLAGGAPAPGGDFGGYPVPQLGAGVGGDQTAMAGSPPPTVALSGSPRDEYDLAYGYILTGDYELAEQSFRSWLASFPSDAQSNDAKFWLGESLYQQGDYREAANSFLDLYKSSPESAKGPDALVKLGMSLAGLGEKDAACATLAEVSKRYPNASSALKGRADEEMRRAGC